MRIDEPTEDIEEHPSQVVDFRYPDEPEESEESKTEASARLFRSILEWIYIGQNEEGAKQVEGVSDRCWVLLWIFLPILREYDQTQIAGRAGKHKQSINRAVISFKKEFPQFAKHMRHTKQ